MIGSEYAMADGRHGLETPAAALLGLPRRQHAGDARPLLPVDHAQRARRCSPTSRPTADRPADGPHPRRPHDGAAGQRYHSRTSAASSRSSGRARISGVLVEQDGIYGALHTVSKEGVVNYLGVAARRRRAPGPRHAGVGLRLPAGPRRPCRRCASPWAPLWLADLIDDKPVPFEETATETTRGNFKPPLWRRCWIGRWHGLASSRHQGGTIDVMAQWVRDAAEGHEAGGSRHAHDALCRQHAGSRHHRRGRLARRPACRSPSRAATAPSSSPSRTTIAERFLRGVDKGEGRSRSSPR